MIDQPKPELSEDEIKFVEALRDGKLPDAMRIFKKHHAVLEPKESLRAQPITRNADGSMHGYGWWVTPELTVRSNNSDDLVSIPDDVGDFGASIVTRMENFGLAFAIVAKLVEYGKIEVNFSNPQWYSEFEICVDGVAEVLNQH